MNDFNQSLMLVIIPLALTGLSVLAYNNNRTFETLSIKILFLISGILFIISFWNFANDIFSGIILNLDIPNESKLVIENELKKYKINIMYFVYFMLLYLFLILMMYVSKLILKNKRQDKKEDSDT